MNYGAAYLQKIIQLQFDIPPHSREKLDRFLADQEPDSTKTDKEKIDKSKQSNIIDDLEKIVITVLEFMTNLITSNKSIRHQYPEKGLSQKLSFIIRAFILSPLIICRQVIASTFLRPNERGMPTSDLSRAFAFLIVAFYITMTVLSALLVGLTDEPIDMEMIIFFLAIIFFCFIFSAVDVILGRFRMRASVERLREFSRKYMDQGESTPPVDSEEYQYLVSSGVAEETINRSLKEQIAFSEKNESKLIMEAYEEVRDNLPPLPRNIKRMLNRVRLQLYLALEKNLFDPNGSITPQHVGKMVVLLERWPQLAQSILADTSIMGDLEANSNSAKKFTATLGSAVHNPAMYDTDELKKFCRSKTTLGPVMRQLVHMEPV